MPVWHLFKSRWWGKTHIDEGTAFQTTPTLSGDWMPVHILLIYLGFFFFCLFQSYSSSLPQLPGDNDHQRKQRLLRFCPRNGRLTPFVPYLKLSVFFFVTDGVVSPRPLHSAISIYFRMISWSEKRFWWEMQSFQPYVCCETYLQMHTIYKWARRVWSIRVINAENECDRIKSPQSSVMFNTDYNWILVAAPNTFTLRWRGSHPPCIGSDCLQCVRADRAAGVEYWCLSPFTVRTQECVGAGEIMLSLKHRERVESREWTEAPGRADSRLPGTHTRTHTHTNTHTHTKSISIDHSLEPQSPRSHTLHFFLFFFLHYLLHSFKKRKKK